MYSEPGFKIKFTKTRNIALWAQKQMHTLVNGQWQLPTSYISAEPTSSERRRTHMTRIFVLAAGLLCSSLAQAAEPVKIGITTILSGPLADRGQSEQYGAQLALDRITGWCPRNAPSSLSKRPIWW
jgi:hypothetical protein